MSTRRAVVPLIVVLALAGAACGDGGTGKKTATPLTQEQANFGGKLALIRGHHLVALELYRAGETQFAIVHAGHPVEEILASVKGEVAESDQDAADALGPSLEAVRTAMKEGKSADQVSAAIDAAADATALAETAVVKTHATTARYTGSLVAGLVTTAAAEYEEAIADGKVKELIEYQDAYAFATLAKRVYAEIEADVRKAGAKEAEEIEEAFAVLAQALPAAASPPATPLSHEAVEQATSQIAHELEETVKALVGEEVAPAEAFRQIDTLLTQLLTEYRGGKATEAAETAAKIYIENYELVEAQVIRLAEAVNKALEPILGSELRAKINAGIPVAELEALVAQARALLAQAKQALGVS